MRYLCAVFLVAAAGIPAAQPGKLALSDAITDLDLAEARQPQPPVALKASLARKDLDLRGDAITLFERIAHEYGLGPPVFDIDYATSTPFQFRLTGADYRLALRALEAATGSFVFPVTEHVFMVAKDSPQKRQELEPNVSVVLEIPAAVSVQEVQELARSVQMTLQIQRLAVDVHRGLVLINDKISKVRPAEAVFTELMHQRPQISLEVELLEVDQTSVLSYGLLMPAQFTLSYLQSQTPLSMLLRGPATQLWGLTLANAALLANLTDSNSRSLFHAEFRAVDGQAGNIHIGEQYPIAGNQYLGVTSGTGPAYTPPPQFTFEDLGLTIKVTPHINDAEEVSLDVEASFKVLTGQSLNAIPIISSRAINSKARVRNGEWAVLAGLLTMTDTKTIKGIPGLSTLPGVGPLLRQNTRNREMDQVLVLLKPSLLSLPPSQFITHAFAVGSEMRSRIPL